MHLDDAVPPAEPAGRRRGTAARSRQIEEFAGGLRGGLEVMARYFAEITAPLAGVPAPAPRLPRRRPCLGLQGWAWSRRDHSPGTPWPARRSGPEGAGSARLTGWLPGCRRPGGNAVRRRAPAGTIPAPCQIAVARGPRSAASPRISGSPCHGWTPIWGSLMTRGSASCAGSPRPHRRARSASWPSGACWCTGSVSRRSAA